MHAKSNDTVKSNRTTKSLSHKMTWINSKNFRHPFNVQVFEESYVLKNWNFLLTITFFYAIILNNMQVLFQLGAAWTGIFAELSWFQWPDATISLRPRHGPNSQRQRMYGRPSVRPRCYWRHWQQGMDSTSSGLKVYSLSAKLHDSVCTSMRSGGTKGRGRGDHPLHAVPTPKLGNLAMSLLYNFI